MDLCLSSIILRIILIFQTVGTVAEKLQLIGVDHAGVGLSLLHDAFGQFHMVQVDDLAALGTYIMCMRYSVAVIPFQTGDHTDGLDGPFVFKHGKIAVDSAQTQIRDLGLQLLIDPFGAGVGSGHADTLQNGVSFLTVFSGSFHRRLLTIMIIVIISKIIIPYRDAFVKSKFVATAGCGHKGESPRHKDKYKCLADELGNMHQRNRQGEEKLKNTIILIFLFAKWEKYVILSNWKSIYKFAEIQGESVLI